MKIGIEAQRLFRKKKHGMDMVVLELIRNLQQIDQENEYVIFVKPDEDRGVISETHNFSVVEIGGGPYPTWEQIALPRAAKRMGCDILHCTSNTAPLYGGIPLIVTLHDIIYLERISIFSRGGTWYQKLGNMYRRWVVPPVVKKAKKVITVSGFEKDRIARFFGINDDKLVAVYNGVGNHFMPVENREMLRQVKEKYRLPERFFFFLGNTDPKKNTPNVLKAFARFNQVSGKNYSLVMLDFEEHALEKILREIGFPEIRSSVHLTGYVINTDLPAIISQSELFLYPSLRESFGIPILEGMACGIPVITSNTSSMPEVAGDAAILVDPYSADKITEAMSRLTTDMDLRRQMIEQGLARAGEFSWKNMATHVLSLYRELYSEINPQP